MKIKLNQDLNGHKKGDILDLGKKPSLYWRRRIKDSKIDNCVEIIDETVKKAEPSKKTGKKEINND